MANLFEANCPHDDSVDSMLVPQHILDMGARTRAIGLETFGSDQVSHDALVEALRYAFRSVAHGKNCGMCAGGTPP